MAAPILSSVKALDKHYNEINTCLLVIDRDTGEVLETLGRLPFESGDGVCGRDWRDVLDVPAEGTAVISQALAAATASPLPPTIVGGSSEHCRAVGGMLVPDTWRGRAAALMFLRELKPPLSEDLEAAVGEQDIVAVLGVHLLEFSPSWGAVETERLMMDLRSGMQQVLREEDMLGLPEGATITVVLRNIEPEAALDISRALLSHLHQRLRGRTGGAQYARACVGLAQRAAGQSPLEVLVAANTALLQAQAGGEERIRFSSPWDPQALAARSLNASGAFRDVAVDSVGRDYLQALVALPFHRDPDYLEAVVRHTLRQGGLQAVAVLRLRPDGQRECLGGAVQAAGRVSYSGMGKVPRVVQVVLRRLEKQSLEPFQSYFAEGVSLLPLPDSKERVWGQMLLLDTETAVAGFRPGSGALQFIGPNLLASLRPLPEGPAGLESGPLPVREMEKGIEGYVLDNMEGAIDQAVFLAGVDIPVAIIGERGTGKMYVARIVHNESGGAPDALVKVDCWEFRSRNAAWAHISEVLQQGEGRTVVFKSPQLLPTDLQAKLARILATRTLSDDQGGARYIARNRFVALFPVDPLELVRRGELDQRLASVFAGFPVIVPPLRERRRAVLRWAHKILEQECTAIDRRMLGFTPDAERALREHDWPGNISEMRDLIRNALTRTDKEWLTPVDLGLYIGISPDGRTAASRERPFLEFLQEKREAQMQYVPSARDELRLALGEALAASLATGVLRPLGAWLDDEIIEAACARFGDDTKMVAEFLHTRPRNISRWLPRVQERQVDRDGSMLWQDARKLVRRWVMEAAPVSGSPQQLAEEMLLSLVQQECADLSIAERAQIMGVSPPTYQKRMKQYENADRGAHGGEAG